MTAHLCGGLRTLASVHMSIRTKTARYTTMLAIGLFALTACAQGDEVEASATATPSATRLAEAVTGADPLMSTARSRTLTDSTFESDVLASPKPFVLLAVSDSCDQCNEMNANFRNALNAPGLGRFDYGTINVDQNPVFRDSYKVQQTPTSFIFSGGKVVTEFTGVKPVLLLMALLARTR